LRAIIVPRQCEVATDLLFFDLKEVLSMRSIHRWGTAVMRRQIDQHGRTSMPDQATIDPQGSSKPQETQNEGVDTHSPPARPPSTTIEFLRSLAWRQAASTLSIEGALVNNAEMQILLWTNHRRKAVQEALDVFAKGCFCRDAAECRAIYAGWWSHSMEDFATEVGEIGSHWTKTYWNLIGAVDGDHTDQR
jgi:hypothetical protein